MIKTRASMSRVTTLLTIVRLLEACLHLRRRWRIEHITRHAQGGTERIAPLTPVALCRVRDQAVVATKATTACHEIASNGVASNRHTIIAGEGLLVVSVPKEPDLQIAFALMIVGIVFSTHSRNVRAKRLVLPVILALFSFVFLESVRRTIDPPGFVLVVLAAILMWNGLAAVRQIRYCDRCGRTLQDRSRRKTCKECRESSSPPA